MLSAVGGVLGLTWGATPQDVAARLEGLEPVERAATRLVFVLEDVSARLMSEDAFCPSVFHPGTARSEGRLTFDFSGEALAGAEVRFSYGYEVLGQKTDTLGNIAMANYARAELQRLIVELSTRYGPPAKVTDGTLRRGLLHGVGAALFTAPDGGPVHLLFGHDGDALAGELRWLAPAQAKGGF